MKKPCVFCGSMEKLTSEHVFGAWLSRIGLSNEAMLHVAGPLNRSPRDLGVTRPFNSKVRDVCGPCNSSWMSRLESVAARVLTPMILGKSGSITSIDQPPVAAWVHKTVLVNMLVSSEEDRAHGYGLPATEYRELFELREQGLPLTNTRFWIGRYQGRRQTLVCVTPMIVKVDGLPEPDVPQAYVMTMVLGELLLHGIRFTTPGLQFDPTPHQSLLQIWPTNGVTIDCGAAAILGDEALHEIEKGIDLRANVPHVALRPWRAATELPESIAEGPLVQLPTPCGEHFVYYPGVLAYEALREIFYAFITSCECGKNYLVKTEPDGAHFKAEAKGRGVEVMYEALIGEEISMQDEGGRFVCKRLSVSAGQ